MPTAYSLLMNKTNKQTNFDLAIEVANNLNLDKVSGLYGEIDDKSQSRKLLLNTLTILKNQKLEYFDTYKLAGEDMWVCTISSISNKGQDEDLFNAIYSITEIPEIMDALGLVRIDPSNYK